ncbi:MAG: metallophosphoesterase [Bacteroidetes bacterium]|nr:metallophosphoesterase [Bacteroidota bacterium]
MRYWNCFFAAACAWVLIVSFPIAGISQQLLHSEILGRPSAQGMIIHTVFSDPVETSVAYGTASQEYTFHTPWQLFNRDSAGEAVSINPISGLNPNTQYYYRLKYRRPGDTVIVTRPEYKFHTARQSGQSFIFTIQADPHLDVSSDTALYRRCIRNELEDNPDFMIELGDFIMTDKLKNSNNTIPQDTIPYRCKLLSSFYESACHSVPLFITLGNHEGEAGWYQDGSPENIAVWNTNYRKKYFPNPRPDGFYSGDSTNYPFVGQREASYSWEWGDALFIVLDPFWFTKPKPDSTHGWRWTLGKMQYDWLKSTLEQSGATFKFVFIHQLVGGDKDGRGGIERAGYYEWGGKNPDGSDGWAVNRPGWYKPIKDLLEENRVTIFFHGHDHLYAKQDLDCLVYQEVPQPSLPNFQGVPQAIDYGYNSGTILTNSGHLRVTVTGDDVTVEYVRAYLPLQETLTRHNKDISASYRIGAVNCYDSVEYGINENVSGALESILAFPNPFSSHIAIDYKPINAEDKCIAWVSDLSGRKVKELHQANTGSKGEFHADWDGTTSDGIPVVNGIYLCTLKSGDRIIRHKILLFRP